MSGSKEAFFERLKQRTHPGSETEQMRDEWIREVESLLHQIRSWLRDSVERGLLAVTPYQFEIHEDRLGTYGAPGLRIDASGVQIMIKPHGRIIIGGQGRIDFETAADNAILIRTGPGEWEFRRLVGGKWEATALNEESFWRILEALVR
jgi:hypothetical protein